MLRSFCAGFSVACAILTLLVLCLAAGCRTVTYSDQKTGRSLSVQSFGTSVGIESATVTTPEGGSLQIQGYKSDASAAVDLANKALDATLNKVP
jgi:hypothetical protein